mgnify:CR=1 FL=1
MQSRNVRLSDAKLYLQWRNRPDVRRYQRTNREILIDEHLAWFENRLGRLEKEPFIVYFEDDITLGFVRFEWRSQTESEVSILINPTQRGMGYGIKILSDAISFFSKGFAYHHLFSSVHKNNLASLKLFRRLGFEQINSPKNEFLEFRFELDSQG